MSKFRRRLGLVFIASAVLIFPAAAGAVSGFNGPLFGLETAPNGDVIVSDASAGLIEVGEDSIGKTISIPGATDAAAIGKGSYWVTTGASGDPQTDSGQALWRVSNGKARQIVNLYDFEVAQNPDGNDPFDSNPYDVASLGGNAALVVDAGGNDLLRVDNKGNVKVLAVFPDGLVSTANIQSLAGCPNPSFFCELPEMMPAQSTPTSVAVGPDGYYYVGELRGFPGPTDASSVWRVSPNADGAMCGSSPDCVKVLDGGFTSIIDLQFGPDGKLYVVELDEASWAAVEIFQIVTGGSVNACDLGSGSCSVVADGIPILTAVTFDNDGNLWAAFNSLIPGLAEVSIID